MNARTALLLAVLAASPFVADAQTTLRRTVDRVPSFDPVQSESVGAIANVGGTARLRNVLIARNLTGLTATDPSSGIFTSGTTAKTYLENCTVVDNDAGKIGRTGVRYASGTLTITNSIVWGHDSDLSNLPVDGSGALIGVWYSNLGNGQNAGIQGCQSVDPVFADAVTYHLKSTAGHYAGGAFGVGFWTTAAASSPLIDRGDPASAYSREPDPNGGRINMGAYGNTEVASKTPTVSITLPVVSNGGSILRGHTSARFRGTLVDDGGQLPDVAFHYWEAGTTITNVVSIGMREEGALAWTIGGLAAGLTYEYRIGAANSAGTGWSSVSSFSTLPANATFYISATGDNTDGLTWVTAFTDALTAFALADSGDTVRFAGETFSAAPGFGMSYVYRLASKSNIRFEGGYQATGATPGPRDPALWPTALARKTTAPTANARVLQLDTVSNVVFDGLVLRDGRYSPGGGVSVSSSAGVVFDGCRLTANWADGGSGGAIYLVGASAAASSSVTLTNCVVDKNEAKRGSDGTQAFGGAAHVGAYSTLDVRRSSFASNTSLGARNQPSYGGAFYLSASTSEINVYDSIITNNTATTEWNTGTTQIGRGGGIYNGGGKIRLRNVLLARNQTGWIPTDPSDGMISLGATGYALLENCTVADNGFGKATAVGIRYGAGVLAVTNSIIWGHGTNDLSNLPLDGGVIRNVGWSLFNDATMVGVAGYVSADPLFSDPAAGDYRLGEGSPALNVGKAFPWMVGAADLAGAKRIQGGAVDLGAYEVPDTSAALLLVR